MGMNSYQYVNPERERKKRINGRFRTGGCDAALVVAWGYEKCIQGFSG